MPRWKPTNHLTRFTFETLPAELALNEVASGRLGFAVVDDPAANERYPALGFTRIGGERLVIVVHPDRDLAGLTLIQLQDLFAGRIRDWFDLGLTPGQVQIVSQEAGTGARAAFQQIVMTDLPLALTALLKPDSAAVASYVAGHPDAVGYVTMVAVEAGVKVVAVDGMRPDQAGYILTIPLNLVLPPQPAPEAQALRDFLLSPHAQSILDGRPQTTDDGS